jgi:hypothetical protein
VWLTRHELPKVAQVVWLTRHELPKVAQSTISFAT